MPAVIAIALLSRANAFAAALCAIRTCGHPKDAHVIEQMKNQIEHLVG